MDTEVEVERKIVEDASSGSDTAHHEHDADNHTEKTESSAGEAVKAEPKEDALRPTANHIASIPNGGLTAWLQVAGAFVLFFNTWGVLNTYGEYQTYYESGVLFQASSSTISWIGAVQSCLLLLVGALTGPIYDAGYFKYLLYTGCFLVVFGQMMLSLCTEYYQVFLAQAITQGLGAGCLFVPSVAIISTYFSTKLSIAIGVAASGSSLGGVIYPIVFYRLLPRVGFGWTTRVIGFIELGTLVVPILFMRVRVLPPAKRKLYDLSAFREAPYVLFTIGTCLAFLGLMVPFFYISYYAQQQMITTADLSFYLLSILNAASVFGRIIPNVLAHKYGSMNVMIPCVVATSVLCFGLIGVHSEAGIVIIALLYGFFSGAFVSLPPSVYANLTVQKQRIGSRIGMAFSIISIFVLVGTPIAGAILGPPTSAHLDWTGTWAFGGATTGAGLIFVVLARFAAADWQMMRKV